MAVACLYFTMATTVCDHCNKNPMIKIIVYLKLSTCCRDNKKSKEQNINFYSVKPV